MEARDRQMQMAMVLQRCRETGTPMEVLQEALDELEAEESDQGEPEEIPRYTGEKTMADEKVQAKQPVDDEEMLEAVQTKERPRDTREQAKAVQQTTPEQTMVDEDVRAMADEEVQAKQSETEVVVNGEEEPEMGQTKETPWDTREQAKTVQQTIPEQTMEDEEVQAMPDEEVQVKQSDPEVAANTREGQTPKEDGVQADLAETEVVHTEETPRNAREQVKVEQQAIEEQTMADEEIQDMTEAEILASSRRQRWW